jgi:shikimate dehydrogenase
MKRFAIIGYPISHSLSPVMYNAAFPAMGIDAVYEAWSTPPEDLRKAVESLRGPDMMGMNVTVPHKEAVFDLVDLVDATAKAIGAVNCVSKEGNLLTGHNTDKYGFIHSLRAAGCDPAGKRALILGAGGSARAVAYGLAEAGVGSISIAGRTAERVEALAAHVEQVSPRPIQITRVGWQDEGCVAASMKSDLIVNCTPMGMLHTPEQDESPLPAEAISAGVWVYDLVYNPSETPLLSLAKQAGALPVSGLDMLVHQAAESVRLWTGREAPIDIMRSAAEAALAERGR